MSEPDEKPVIDLPQTEWRQIEGPKRREPILMPGWGWALMAALVPGIGLVIARLLMQ